MATTPILSLKPDLSEYTRCQWVLQNILAWAIAEGLSGGMITVRSEIKLE